MVGMVGAVSGVRRGPLVIFTDLDGGRHAVRVSAVIAVSDADQARDSALLQLPGNRAVLVQMPLDAVLDWFIEVSAVPMPRTSRDVLQSAVSTFNLRHGFMFLLELLLAAPSSRPTSSRRCGRGALPRPAASRPTGHAQKSCGFSRLRRTCRSCSKRCCRSSWRRRLRMPYGSCGGRRRDVHAASPTSSLEGRRRPRRPVRKSGSCLSRP